MALRVVDVKGDGHCYYRCIWNIVKDQSGAKDAMMLTQLEDDGEDDMAESIRYFVSLSLKYDKKTVEMFDNLMQLAGDVDQVSLTHLLEMYPLVTFAIGEDVDREDARRLAGEHIADSNVYASSFEHDVVSRVLAEEAGIRLIVLSAEDGDTKEDLADRWLQNMDKALPRIGEPNIAMLVNIGNYHYRYVKFRGRTVTSTAEMMAYVAERMAEDSEEESEGASEGGSHKSLDENKE